MASVALNGIESLSSAAMHAHAVLLHGAPAAETQALAKKLAMAWMCELETGCGECRSCRALGKDQSMDFLGVAPAGLSAIIPAWMITPEAKVPDSETATMPPVNDFVLRPPINSLRRVVMIERAERMNGAATAALLKTLEEPPERVRFVLTTDRLSAVALTIRSRCLLHAVAPQAAHSLGELSPMERCFGSGSAPVVLAIREQTSAYERLFSVLQAMAARPNGAGLGHADAFREVADDFDEKLMGGKRSVHTEMLRCLGQWVRDFVPEAPELAIDVAECHRRVIGNGQFGLQTDPLFCKICVALAMRGNSPAYE